MQDEPTLADYWRIIKKKRKFILTSTLAIVLITAIISIVCPKTYESEAMIELGKVGEIELQRVGETEVKEGSERLIFKPEEAKNIIKSSTIINPVIEKYYKEEDEMTLDRFNDYIMDVEIITEKISLREVRVTPYVSLKIKADNATKCRDIALDVVNGFFDYTKEEFEEQKQVFIKGYNKTKEGIKKELSIRNSNIRKIKEEISNINELMDSLSKETSNDLMTKNILLNDLLGNYKEMLLEEEKWKTNTEGNLRDAKFELDNRIANTEEFKIISYPQVPLKPSKPIIWLNLVVALVIGLFISVSFAFLQESVTKK